MEQWHPADHTWAIVQLQPGHHRSVLTQGLAYAVVQQGHTVLVVDVDPRAGLTRDTLPAMPTRTLDNFLLNRDPELGFDTHPTAAGWHLLPGGPRIEEALTLSSSAGARATELRLNSLLPALTRYDTVLIDTPAGDRIPTIEALISARHVLIPALTTDEGRDALLRTLGVLGSLPPGSRPHIAGIVPILSRNGGTVAALEAMALDHDLPLHPEIYCDDFLPQGVNVPGLSIDQSVKRAFEALANAVCSTALSCYDTPLRLRDLAIAEYFRNAVIATNPDPALVERMMDLELAPEILLQTLRRTIASYPETPAQNGRVVASA